MRDKKKFLISECMLSGLCDAFLIVSLLTSFFLLSRLPPSPLPPSPSECVTRIYGSNRNILCIAEPLLAFFPFSIKDSQPCLSVCSSTGFIVDFISVPVTSAFTSATSLIIVGSQLKNLLGISYSSKGFADSIYMLAMRMDDSGYWDAVLAIGCCVFLLALRVGVHQATDRLRLYVAD